ncbi:MAG: FtsK/SpoIIIE domain-containing protein [Acidimicrobiia bacterium]|nr:FtsK/SpoIIIE domain-containing protein [Acidimicrobiia bacterium]
MVVRRGEAEYEVVLSIAEAGATVADLARALGAPASEAIAVDGRTVAEATPLAELVLGDGSVLATPLGDPVAERRQYGPRGIFNRPPRRLPVHDEVALRPPPRVAPPSHPMRFAWSALAVPLLLGLLMAVLVHPRMALFALFAPAMLLGNWFEERRRLRRDRRDSEATTADSLRRFRADVVAAHTAASRRRRARAVMPGALPELAERVDSTLWERRSHHADFMALPLGTGCVPWRPALDDEPSGPAAEVVAEHSHLHSVPVEVTLDAGTVVGVAGSRQRQLGVARQLLAQSVAHHGPADLRLTVATDWVEDWDWVKWLPHLAADGTGRLRIAVTDEEIKAVAELLPAVGDPTVRNLVVLDLADLVAGARSQLRRIVQNGDASGICAIALAPQENDLPSMTTTIVSLGSRRAELRVSGEEPRSFVPWLMGSAAARRLARSLARLEDPEAVDAGVRLPETVRLGTLLGIGDSAERVIEERWARDVAGLPFPLGAGPDGHLRLDLVRDGPHALLGGTTGSGKSELLRSMVAGLAASVSPHVLNFVLIDYKGGSAFDVCAGLPHTAGVVTDLDGNLAGRALTCLNAELRYREHSLRDAGVADIAAYPPDRPPLPRLLIVVDEFAALATDVPGFVDALVGVAQRGRSLGVHLVLATQRPAGIISDHIKANTNLRIALRVQDGNDSVDVVGTPQAATISSQQPGRAIIRRGADDVVEAQTALASGRTAATAFTTVSVRPFVARHEQPAPAEPAVGDGPSDLEQIVSACRRVAVAGSFTPPRSPWPEPLPTIVTLSSLPNSREGSAAWALIDEPAAQLQTPAHWSPSHGNLLIYGLPGSGTTTALISLAITMASVETPERLHLHGLDFDDQHLVTLRPLAHVGAMVSGNDRERQVRLLRRLAVELRQRRDALAEDPTALDPQPQIVTLIDNYAGFADAFADPADTTFHNALARLVADGPGLGMTTIITAKQPMEIPSRIAGSVQNRIAFRLADRYDYAAIGVPPTEPPRCPGRAFEAGTGIELQVALPDRQDISSVCAEPAKTHVPWTVSVLPRDVPVRDLAAASRIAREGWFLPLGIGDTTLSPVGLTLRTGDHALITGPPRAGKTTALRTLAAVARAADADLPIVAIAGRRSELRSCPVVDEVLHPDCLEAAVILRNVGLLLIDDAEHVADAAVLRSALRNEDSRLRIVAAGSTDALRSMYGHWTQDMRRSRIGCALRPDTVADGDFWQIQLPRTCNSSLPAGRGYLVANGHAELFQLGCE